MAAPILSIVGAQDQKVLQHHEKARAQLDGVENLKPLPGATHLFDEPGALEQVADLATEWFAQRLASG